MNINECDQRRIDRFFEDDAQGIDGELAARLEACEDCRGYFDSQAAPEQQWKDARTLLRPHEYDVAGTAEFSAGGGDTQAAVRSRPIQAVLDALLPSDDPHRLGRLGTYEVTGVVGAGGMGVVLKAVDPSLDRVVALKVLAPHLAGNETARRRFAREAKAAAAVLHPNVIPIHSVAAKEETPYLVMAYIRGSSLQKRLEQEGPLPLVETLRIGSQIAAGLAAAHEQGLVHRDIKPENILLEEGVERVTITDFGLARAVDDNTVTQHGTIAGTPMYMSPEQAAGLKVDGQSDLFSLGSVLYALCTGKPPYEDESSYGVMRKIIDDSPTPIDQHSPETPDWLINIIGKMMAKKKEDRFVSASEIHELLDGCLSHVQQPDSLPLPTALDAIGPSDTTPPADQTEREKKPEARPRRFRLAIGGLCLVGVCVSFVLFQAYTRHRRQIEMQAAYGSLSSSLRNGGSRLPISSLDQLLSHPDGYGLLRRLDDQSERLSFTDDGLPDDLQAAAMVLHENASRTGKSKFTLRAARENLAVGPTVTLPTQLRFDSINLEGGSAYKQTISIRYSASTEEPHRDVIESTLNLKPGSEYDSAIAVTDIVQDRVDWNSIWKDGRPTGIVSRTVRTTPRIPDPRLAVVAIKAIQVSLNTHKLLTGQYPTMEEGLSVLASKPESESDASAEVAPVVEFMVNDPWGNPYGYQNPGRHGNQPDVWSVGPDGKTGTDDDIRSWELPDLDNDEAAPAENTDAKDIVGTWRVIFAEDSGRSSPAMPEIRAVITPDTLTMELPGRDSVSTYTLDPTTTPRSIDLTENGRTKAGIYDLQGDTLRICFAEHTDERPTAFDSQPDSVNDVILTMKRVPADQPVEDE